MILIITYLLFIFRGLVALHLILLSIQIVVLKKRKYVRDDSHMQPGHDIY